jgi:hypothetical protein
MPNVRRPIVFCRTEEIEIRTYLQPKRLYRSEKGGRTGSSIDAEVECSVALEIAFDIAGRHRFVQPGQLLLEQNEVLPLCTLGGPSGGGTLHHPAHTAEIAEALHAEGRHPTERPNTTAKAFAATRLFNASRTGIVLTSNEAARLRIVMSLPGTISPSRIISVRRCRTRACRVSRNAVATCRP